MDDTTDIVDDIFSRVRKILGNNFNGDIALRLENEECAVRRHWGGVDTYVPKIKRRQRDIAKKNALNEINKGVRVIDAAKKNGISRAEVYRLLNKK